MTKPIFLKINSFFISSQQYPWVPRKVINVFLLYDSLINNEKPKSMKMYFLYERLYSIFYGLISACMSLKECIILKFSFNYYYIPFMKFILFFRFKQYSIANITLFWVMIISYPNILCILGPIFNVLAKSDMKYYW